MARMARALGAGEVRCHTTFWSFAGAVIAGNLACHAAAAIARNAAGSRPEKTKAAIAGFTGNAAFWLVGGLMWVALNRD